MASQDILPPTQPPGLFLGFDHPPPPLPATHIDAQNHDRDMDGASEDAAVVLPPIPPPQLLEIPPASEQQPPPAVQVNINAAPGELADGEARADNANTGDNEEESRSGSEHSDSEGEDGDTRENDSSESYPFNPIDEDKSAPCDDELTFIGSREEHSAEDHAYWEHETFFDLDDPELVPGDSGRIDWLVEKFNGTKEDPNKELIMRSPKIMIGGYEWQIKFYPKGNNTEFLSVYLECTTMLELGFQGQEEMTQPPLPTIAGYDTKLTKRRSIAAQVSVVMYNPAEPRVYEHKTDAHQYHAKSADFGWKYFSRESRYEFYYRRHGQRQAILRDDKLAFSAYIRVVHDPTGCMWDHDRSEERSAVTGLRPLGVRSSLAAAMVPLLHYRLMRDYLYTADGATEDKSGVLRQLQIWLERMMGRFVKRKHFRYSPHAARLDNQDVIEVMQSLRKRLRDQDYMPSGSELDMLFAAFDPMEGAPVCDRRLKTAGHASLQSALEDAREHFAVRPPLLAVELERQEFDRETRRWKKLNNHVELDDRLMYGDQAYTLYAFVTHSGELGSGLYNAYVRPSGQGGLWYAYGESQVSCLTRKQAVGAHCGSAKKADGKKDSKDLGHGFHGMSALDTVTDEVAYLVYYVKNDIAPYAFASPAQEKWNVPEYARKHRKTEAAPESEKRHDSGNASQESEKVDAPPAAPAPIPNESAPHRHPRRDRDRDEVFRRRMDYRHMERTYGIGERSQTGTLTIPPPVPPPGVADLMDGDDVVMSDAEDDSSQSQTPIDGMISGINRGIEEQHEQHETAHLSDLVVDYFSREFFEGQATAEGKYQGQGHLIATNGDEYVGLFQDGLPHGSGKMVYSTTGNVYEGEWSEGRHHGQGTLTELKTGNVYRGGWHNGKKHGNFTLTGTVTDEDKQCCQICYEKEMNTAFYDCGHVVGCKDCASRIDTCPVCRKRVVARLELYGVNVSME